MALSELLKKGSVALMIKVATAGLSYIMFVLLARWMTPVEYGKFAMGFSLATFLAMVGTGGQHNFVLRYIPQYDGQNKLALMHGAVAYSKHLFVKISFGTLCLSLVGVYLYSLFKPSAQVDYLYYAVLLLLPMAGAEYVSHIMRARGSVVGALVPRDILWRVLIPTLGGGFGIALTAPVVLLYAAGSLLLIVAVQYIFSERALLEKDSYITPEIDKEDWWATSKGLWTSSVVGVASQNISVILVGYLLTPQDAGLFFIIYKVSAIMLLPQIAVNLYLSTKISKIFFREKEKLLKICILLTLYGFLNALVFIGIFSLFGEQVLSMFGKSYHNGHYFLVMIAVIHSINCVCGPINYITLMTGYEKTEYSYNILFFLLWLITVYYTRNIFTIEVAIYTLSIPYFSKVALWIFALKRIFS
ncbi:lipopolysaccharide biosynthesis protein [Kordiimonas sp. SCSIO 12603]|uniref:lipopolysaccharide biosynthesis protein n=1 Tax=Kordiimonas sp. SCSIO 12603 TaxID=2829596 RepID=UPI0021048D4E|nr:lipopolysaccharide biosynthesis protein [Kordiimonas sp. SCSIO 12603]UTW58954.1 lipopolysaccharide biosynthesis protein [Kordiimonas sp. SCSIO 12603]